MSSEAVRACRSYRAWIERSVEAELSLTRSLELDAHLDDCEACRAWHTDALQLEAWLGELAEPALERCSLDLASEGVWARIDQLPKQDIARSELKVERLALPRRLGWIAGAVAAASLFVLVRSIWPTPGFLGQQSPENLDAHAESAESPTQVREAESAQVPTIDPAGPTEGASDWDVLDDLDLDRLAAARELVRDNLLAEWNKAQQEDLSNTDFVMRVQASCEVLRSERWPVLRLVEHHLDSKDADLQSAELAKAALVFLSECGLRSEMRSIAEQLKSDVLRPTAMAALLHMQSRGLPGLPYLIEEPATWSALGGLLGAQEQSEAVALLLEREGQRRLRGSLTESGARLLGDLGEPGCLALMELGRQSEWRNLALAELKQHPEAPHFLSRELELAGSRGIFADWTSPGVEWSRGSLSDSRTQASARGQMEDDFWSLELVRELRPESGLLALRRLCRQEATRNDACRVLLKYHGFEALDLALEMLADSSWNDDSWRAALPAFLRASGRDFDFLVERWVTPESPVRVRDEGVARAAKLFELLSTEASPECGWPLTHLLKSQLLNDADQLQCALVLGELEISPGGLEVQAALSALGEVCSACTPQQARLAAACVISIARLGGEAELEANLRSSFGSGSPELLTYLIQPDRQSVSLLRVARMMGPLLHGNFSTSKVKG